jgi:Ser/Thr protein kinase RdoA (MazF antagonist)
MTPALCAAIVNRYHLSLSPARRLSGGEECEIWLAASNDGPFIVRISPGQRSLAQLGWTHTLMLSLWPLVPVVVAPLRAIDGSTLFLYNGRPVALFPFVEGTPLDREQPAQRHAAAELLARLHRAMLADSAAPSQPQRYLTETSHLPRLEDPEALIDPEFDAWHATLLQQPAALTCGPIHGDYYRRNLLVRDGMIKAVIDWDNAHHDFLMQEVAWSTWEFCQIASGDDLHLEHARAFVQDYRDAGGPCKAEEYALLIPFIRWRLREEIRFNLAAAAAGQSWDPEYVDDEFRAFERLRGLSAAWSSLRFSSI